MCAVQYIRMQFTQFFLLYIISVPIIVILDYVWLGILMRDFFKLRLAHLLGEMNWLAVGVFYLIFVVGLTFFATYPTALRGTLLSGLILGGLFGFFTYATYDLTNLATLRNWPVSVVLVDIMWGTFLGAAVTVCSVVIYNYLSGF